MSVLTRDAIVQNCWYIKAALLDSSDTVKKQMEVLQMEVHQTSMQRAAQCWTVVGWWYSDIISYGRTNCQHHVSPLQLNQQ